jgi:hypothetical protein
LPKTAPSYRPNGLWRKYTILIFLVGKSEVRKGILQNKFSLFHFIRINLSTFKPKLKVCFRADSSLVDKPGNQPVHGGLTGFGKVTAQHLNLISLPFIADNNKRDEQTGDDSGPLSQLSAGAVILHKIHVTHKFYVSSGKMKYCSRGRLARLKFEI